MIIKQYELDGLPEELRQKVTNLQIMAHNKTQMLVDFLDWLWDEKDVDLYFVYNGHPLASLTKDRFINEFIKEIT